LFFIKRSLSFQEEEALREQSQQLCIGVCVGGAGLQASPQYGRQEEVKGGRRATS
jgi:hypothetical protein